MVRKLCIRWASIFLLALALERPLTLTPSISAPKPTPCWGVFVTQGHGSWCSAQKFKFRTVEDAVRYADTWTMRGRQVEGIDISSEWIEDNPEIERELSDWPDNDVIYYRFVVADGTNDLLTGDNLLDSYASLRICIKPVDPNLYFGEIF
eukprot:Skav220724  [mRNA]  locus=scaffold2753:103054:103503:- [translate_table: standard]